jgi:hypothetical protein
MGFKELCPGVMQNFVRTSNVLGFSQVIKTEYIWKWVLTFCTFPNWPKSMSGLVIIKSER